MIKELKQRSKPTIAGGATSKKTDPAAPAPHATKATPQAHDKLPRGMTNQNGNYKGNKCYRNALLQALFSVASIRRAVQQTKGRTAAALQQIAYSLDATTDSNTPVPELLSIC